MISLPNSQTLIFNDMSEVSFSGVYLTVEKHGCVYTVDTEGELFYAPIYQDGSVNLEEFDFVDWYDAVDYEVENELNEIQSALVNMMRQVGLYFQPPVAV